jgi:hypothetical protein
MLIESHDVASEGPLPKPRLFRYPGADVVDLPGDPSVVVQKAKSA